MRSGLVPRPYDVKGAGLARETGRGEEGKGREMGIERGGERKENDGENIKKRNRGASQVGSVLSPINLMWTVLIIEATPALE